MSRIFFRKREVPETALCVIPRYGSLKKPLTEVVTEENHRWIPNVLIDSPDKMPEPTDDETQDSKNTNLAPSPAKITANPR